MLDEARGRMCPEIIKKVGFSYKKRNGFGSAIAIVGGWSDC